jgi:hypothetical protein
LSPTVDGVTTSSALVVVLYSPPVVITSRLSSGIRSVIVLTWRELLVNDTASLSTIGLDRPKLV